MSLWSRALSAAGSLAQQALENPDGLVSVVSQVDQHIKEARERRAVQATLPPAREDDLRLGIKLLRVADLAYAESTEALADALRAEGLTLLRFFSQQGARPQWYLCRGPLPGSAAMEAEAMFCVFRGTDSKADLLRDLMAVPTKHASGMHFHHGFLSGVCGDDSVSRQLAANLNEEARGMPLYLVGHSLGGSLATTTVLSGLVPPTHHGPIVVVTFGSPPVLFRQPAPAQLPPAVARTRFLCFVNDADVVPRLLGSPLPLVTRTLLTEAASRQSSRSHASGTGQADAGASAGTAANVLAALPQYCHLEHAEIVLLRDGRAAHVGAVARPSVLHLHEAVSSNFMRDHGTKRYEKALAAAAGGGQDGAPRGGSSSGMSTGTGAAGGGARTSAVREDEHGVPIGLPVASHAAHHTPPIIGAPVAPSACDGQQASAIPPPPSISPPSATAAKPESPCGKLVALHSLQSRTDLNGRLGTCVSGIDPATGRVTVEVEDGVGAVSLSAANLRVLE